MAEHENIFWDLIRVLDGAGFLPYVMIVGSWAEYLYPHYLGEGYIPNLKTRDIDVYYGNPLRELPDASGLEQQLKEAGFIPYADGTGRKTFFKDSVELEFLAIPLGSHAGMVVIPDTTITAETLEDLSVLDPLVISVDGYEITVPTPASYIVHKLLINPKRKPEHKRAKDIEAVRSLLLSVSTRQADCSQLQKKLQKISPEQKSVILEVSKTNNLSLPDES